MKRMKTRGGNPAENPLKSVFQEGPNPLLNYAILTELMSYLPVPDLRHSRLVNSAWRTAATPHLEKISWLKCHKAFPRSCNKEQDLDDSCISKHAFHRDLAGLGQLGIQNVRLHLPAFLSSSTSKEIFLKLLEECGADFRNVVFPVSIETLELFETGLTYLPNLVRLTVRFDMPFSPATVGPFWTSSTLPRGMPSIKRICIWNHNRITQVVRGSVNANNHYNSLKRLLQIAPNLEILELQNSLRIKMPNSNPVSYADPWKDVRQSENLYLRLLAEEGKVLCPKLKDLNFCGSDCLSTWDLKLILQLDINLRQLVLRTFISDSTYISEAVEDVCPLILSLLERHRSSLEVLELRIESDIKNDGNSPPIPLRFPCFRKLRRLLVELQLCDHGSDGTIRFEDVDYATQFPALKDLEVLQSWDNRLGSLLYSDNSEEKGNSSTFDRRIDFYNQFFPDDGQVCSTLQRLTVEVPHPNIRRSKNMPTAYLQFSCRLDLMFPNVHNHAEVKAFRAMKPTDFEQFVANETPSGYSFHDNIV